MNSFITSPQNSDMGKAQIFLLTLMNCKDENRGDTRVGFTCGLVGRLLSDPLLLSPFLEPSGILG